MLAFSPPNLADCSCVPIAATIAANVSSGSKRRLSTMSGAPFFIRCFALYEIQMPLALVEATTGDEPVQARELGDAAAGRPHHHVEERGPGLGVRLVEGPDEALGVADVDPLLEVDGGRRSASA